MNYTCSNALPIPKKRLCGSEKLFVVWKVSDIGHRLSVFGQSGKPEEPHNRARCRIFAVRIRADWLRIPAPCSLKKWLFKPSLKSPV